MVIISNSDNSKTAQQLFLKLSETIQFNAIYMMEVVTKDGNFLVKTDFEARGVTGEFTCLKENTNWQVSGARSDVW